MLTPRGLVFLLVERQTDPTAPPGDDRLHVALLDLDTLELGEPLLVAEVAPGSYDLVRTDGWPLLLWRSEGETRAWAIDLDARTSRSTVYPSDADYGLYSGSTIFTGPPVLSSARTFGDLLLYSDHDHDDYDSGETWLHAYDLTSGSPTALPPLRGGDVPHPHEAHDIDGELFVMSHEEGLLSLDLESLTWGEQLPIPDVWRSHGAFPLGDGRALVGVTEAEHGGLLIYDANTGRAALPTNFCEHGGLSLSRIVEHNGAPMLIEALQGHDVPQLIGHITME